MENRSHALMTGFFTLTLLVAAILFGVWFNRDRVERVPYLLATTLSVPGLNPQATVRYRGLEVGKVDAIDFDTQKAGQILVHISVAPDTPFSAVWPISVSCPARWWSPTAMCPCLRVRR